MDATEREAYFDKEIGPALLELARKCEVAGLSFLNRVEWAPNEGATTSSIQPHPGIGMKITYSAALANGNADALIMAMLKYAKESGHNSIYLHLLEKQMAVTG